MRHPKSDNQRCIISYAALFIRDLVASMGAVSSTFELLRTATRSKQHIVGYYDGFYRQLCPHVLGWKRGVPHLFAFQFGGQSLRPLPVSGQWKCMEVEKLSVVSVLDGPWHTGEGCLKYQTCIEEVDSTAGIS